MLIPDFSVLVWIIVFSLFGGALSVSLAGLFALNLRTAWVPMLVSYAIGAMLGAVFLEILPHAFKEASSVESISATLLLGLLLFFVLEKLVIWRHCHGDHCEVHAIHNEQNCPETHAQQGAATKYKAVTTHAPSIVHSHAHSHHDSGRSGMMIMVGDTFHNFVDGILIAAAFLVDVKLGMVTALAIISHEIPQEVGDFLILLHSGYTKKQAFIFNLVSSLATLVGGLIAYFALQYVMSWIPYILGLAAASMLYVAVADLIPSLHKRTELKATLSQVLLISLGVSSIWVIHHLIE
ncbi:MAG: ZIP family metal transporter [Methylotenera sp.]|nr:ZIP family metal transporter [Methylotenera sp.]MDP2402765.1 ZIP family metal transporter [Methylotenera sp.]MDP3094607.1 ZIP family metal transporter [Methylotenera sp.]MDZ4223752.1 ZIP family metal transporter [Methylotenera sp.]